MDLQAVRHPRRAAGRGHVYEKAGQVGAPHALDMCRGVVAERRIRREARGERAHPREAEVVRKGELLRALASVRKRIEATPNTPQQPLSEKPLHLRIAYPNADQLSASPWTQAEVCDELVDRGEGGAVRTHARTIEGNASTTQPRTDTPWMTLRASRLWLGPALLHPRS